MASLADVFKEKERSNWLKAWLAIDIAKSGLEHLADNEAQTFHQHIYSQVTSTLKSQSATCTSCNTTNLLQNQKCPNQICDKVCQEIIKEHRYKKCSWNNTSAPLWQTHYWEIAKCYIQTDGYADKISIQDTDFNGVVSFMLNCTRFNSKFSFPITKGKPTLNKPACLLYKAREVHKAVRHSSQMEVTDVDLQDYFTTLNNLLKDSSHLSKDNVAKNAVVKLAKLEKDTLLLTTAEMMCFLDAVGTTLKQHLKGIAKDVVDASVNDLRVNTTLCIENIKDFMSNCKQELAKQADIHKQDIDEHVDSQKQGIDDHTGRHKQGIDEHVKGHKQGMDKHADIHKQGMDKHADRYKQGMDEHADRHKQGMDEHADRHKLGMDEHAGRHKKSMDEHADRQKQGIDEHTSRHKPCLDEQAEKCIKDIQEQFGNTTFTETTYKQSCKDMFKALTKYYSKRFCHVNIFPLDDWAEEKLLDIYMPPNITLMAKEKGFFKKTFEQILTYKNMFLSYTKPNQQIFIQGEAGYGKSTFLAKLVLDWCTITSEQSAETTLPIDDTTTRFSSNTQMGYYNVFDDLTSLKDFKYVFHVTLRESVGQFEIEKMINTQIVDSIYSSEEDRGKAYRLLNEIMKRERCLVLLDGLDEWTGTGDHHNLPTLADEHSLCVLMITTRPWKMTQAKILDSQICVLLQLDGVNNVLEVSRTILGCRKDFKSRQDLDKKHADRHKQGMDELAGKHKQSMDEHARRHKQCLDEQTEKCIKDCKDKLPKDVQQLDDKAITLFYKALEHGKEKVNNVRLMVVGMCGVGKTSLVNNLIWEFRKQKTNKKTLSTEGIAIHRCKLMTGGDWCLDTELKGVKFGGRIQKVVCNNNQISTNTLSETSASSNYLLVERVTSTEDHETQTQTEPLQTFKESIDLHKKDEIVQQGIKVAKKMLETTSDNSEKSKASLDESKNEITVSVWDFAGQTLYYSTHHFFLNERSIYVVVMDMTRSLKDVVSKSDAIGICCGLVDSCTYLDIFKFWLNSIHMHSDYQSGERTIKPTVILVGTRKDEMQGSAEEKEKNMNLYFDNALCSFDKHSPIFNHIYKNRFLVNNLSPEDTAFAELRKEIISLAAKQDYWGKEYPVRWIHMEQTLDKMRDEKRQIVKMKDVVKEDLENIHPLGKEELTSFLELQHKQGNIIFFNSGDLKDFVVLAPQWIIEAFKCFIPHNQKIEATVLKNWEEYKKYAILEPNVLDEIMKNSPTYIHEYQSAVINYMEYLNIIAKPLTSEEGITGIPLDFYIVPCLLNRAPPPLHDFTSPPDKPQTPVLAFVFCGKFLPPALFHRLVAVCIRAWPVSQERDQYCLFNGLAIFTLNETYTLRIWYVDYIIYTRIVCCSENEKLDNFIWLFQEVRRKLKKSLKDFVHQSSLVFEECIQCPDMKVSVHNKGLFIVKQFKYKNAIACPVCNPHAVTRSNAMKHWFKERLDRIETDDEKHGKN
ncbi:hypothetical protein DPMN_158547 [Dreissena polymorpha]|uniref:NACHT domain-containing protein n=1 Tax=Dreissena polymorpha TaxID=45954 RepID=A0A9D4IM32_DREPO|nr:hypothetical protein DPMN_158547 [Dreissena polymorpha]